MPGTGVFLFSSVEGSLSAEGFACSVGVLFLAEEVPSWLEEFACSSLVRTSAAEGFFFKAFNILRSLS